MRKLFLFAVIATLLTSCVKDIEVRGNQPDPEGEEANSFDFSTVQSVNLTVDYSAFNGRRRVNVFERRHQTAL